MVPKLFEPLNFDCFSSSRFLWKVCQKYWWTKRSELDFTCIYWVPHEIVRLNCTCKSKYRSGGICDFTCLFWLMGDLATSSLFSYDYQYETDNHGFSWTKANGHITKTRLFKYIENFISKNWKFSDKKLWYFSYFCSKHRLWVLVRTTSPRRF